MESFTVPLSHIVVSQKLNSRSVYEIDSLKALAADIKAAGMMNPLLVRPIPGQETKPGTTSYRYELVCGTRRHKAAEIAELGAVPVVLQDLSDVDSFARIVHENKDREDFHFLDRAEAWKRWQEAGASAEQIAKEMDVSKSAVHATIALCKLTPEVKKLCWDDRFNETQARDVATVPGELHSKLLKELLAPGPTGQPLTTRESKEVIARYRLDLAKADFDPAEKDLLKDVKDCMACPYRSANRLELFGEVKNDNLCTNPTCFGKKSDAAWERRVDDGEHNRGPRCVQGKSSTRLFDDRGNLRDDVEYISAAAECHEDSAQRQYSSLIGEAGKKSIVLARSPKTGVVHELLERVKLKELLDAGGKIRRRPGATPDPEKTETKQVGLTKEERQKLEEKRRVKQLAKMRIIAAVVGKVEKRDFDKKDWSLLALSLFNGALQRTLERRDIQESPMKYVTRLTEGQLRGLVFEGSLEIDLYGSEASDKYPAKLMEVAKQYDVDVKAIESEVFAEERAKAAVTKVEKKPDSTKAKEKK